MVFRTLLEQTRIGRGRYETSHRRDLYNSCSSERVWASRGTPYPCNQYDLDECTSDYNHSSHSARSPEQATIELERFLNSYVGLTSTVQAAIDRLRAGLQIHDWKPDIVIKAFHDLDIVFFDGKLHGLVTISWHCAPWWIDQEKSRDGHRHQQALTDYSGNRKAAIHLNAWGILLDAPDAKVAMWSVVLHEMVHAYEHVMCGSSPPTSYDRFRGWTDGHGLMFRRLIRPVHERAMHHLNMPVIHLNYTEDHREERYEI